ncbi:ATP-binding cassette domain-containing protein [Saccharopolyspora shandongensis]|uniref:ATP-binding cassette domain-containing protein n=1 Tax=Saccharopolyspora shandongensis TaxID=418495 RepID=UPI003F4E1A48
MTFEVGAGEKVSMVGTNGAGKSTLLRAVLGLHPLASGQVEVGGVVASDRRGWSLRRKAVAWIPQLRAAGRFPLLLGELLDSSGAADAARAAAGELSLGGLDRRGLHTLSGGQLQRAWLARAVGCVAAGAGVVLADEPTAALDFSGQQEVSQLLVSLPVTLLVATHDRALVAACDRSAEMAAGRLREIA